LKVQLRLPMLPSRCWPVLTCDVADLHAVATQTNQVTVIEIQGSWAGVVLILTLPARTCSTPRPFLARRVGCNQSPMQLAPTSGNDLVLGSQA
jgi:hypothetical protein